MTIFNIKIKSFIKILFINILVLSTLIGVIFLIALIFNMPHFEESKQTNIYSDNCRTKKNKELKYRQLIPNKSCTGLITINGKVVKKLKITIDKNGFRETPSHYNKNKGSIIFFGCSYTFGYGLNDNETFPWKVSMLTKRKTYNVAYHGYGPQHMLLALESRNFIKKIPKADVIVYVFMRDHLNRPSGLNNINDNYYPMFKLNKGKLIYYTTPPEMVNSPYKIDIYKKLQYAYASKINDQTEDATNLFVAIIKESKNIAMKKYPNVRFVFFDLDGLENLDKKLQKNGIEVLKLYEIFSANNIQEKYITIDHHPNAEFWEKVSPKFVKKLGL